MALDRGKKEVKLKPINSEVPHVETKSKLSIAADAFQPAFEQMEKNALALQRANWMTEFMKSTTEAYTGFQSEFKNDPDGMSTATNTWTQNKLESVPPAYRIEAASILAHKNANMIGYANNNYITIQTNNAIAGNVEKMAITAEDTYNAYEVILNDSTSNTEAKIAKINLETQNQISARLNHDAHESGILADNGTITKVSHDKLVNNSVEQFKKNYLLAIMQTLPEDQAFLYLQSWLNGKDLYPVEDQSNPTFAKVNQYYESIENREKTFREVWNIYNNIRGTKLNSLNKNKDYDFDGATQKGGAFHWSNFLNGNNKNTALYIKEFANGASVSETKKLIKHKTNMELIADHAAAAMNGEYIHGLNKKDKELMFEMIMWQHNIFNPKEIIDVNHPQFMAMKTIFKKQGHLPEVWKNYLNSPTGDLSEDTVYENFIRKLDLYNEIKNDFSINELDTNDGFLKYAANNDFMTRADLIDASKKWGSKDNKVISEYVENLVTQDVNKFHFMINEALDGNPDWFDDIFKPFRSSVSRDLSLSTIFGDGNKYSSVLFPDSWTMWAQSPSELFEDNPQLLAEFSQKVKEKIILNAPNSSFNLYDKKNSVITNAVFEALDEMLHGGWAPSKYTKDGKYHLTKNGIENEFGINGTALNADAMAHIDAWWEGLPDDLKSGALGFKDDGSEWTLQEIKNVIMDTDTNIIYEPTNHTVNGKVGYKISIKNPNGKIIRITDGNAIWQPDGYDKVINNDAPANNAQLVEWLAQDRKNFIDNWLGPHKPTDAWYETVTKKASHGIEKMKIRMADWSWMIDFPFVDDIPHEWKPFKMLFDIGASVPDLSEKKKELEIQANKEKEKMTYSEEIFSNSLIPDNAKLAEALYAPHEMPIKHYNDQSQFMHFVTNNWQDKSLPLTFRTNNYMAVKKIDGGWNGALDLKNEGNTAAVFAHPADSIRAGVIVMMNMSTITNTKVLKRYGDQPSIRQILLEYAENNIPYLKAAEEAGFDVSEKINFQDQQQMHKLIKFMIKHEMGTEAFNKYYPEDNLILDAYIQQGYRNGLNHFAGKYYYNK